MSRSGCHVEWTEKMRGWFAFGERDYQSGYEQGRGESRRSALMFRLTIGTDDVYRFIDHPDHEADAHGWIASDVLGGRLSVEKGTFNLFKDAGLASKCMLYRLWFSDAAGHPLTLSGYKDIRTPRLTAMWPETTTLYTKILSGHVQTAEDEGAPLVGAGILRILPTDFAWQMTTFRARSSSDGGGLGGLAAFGGFFVSQLWNVYGPRWLGPARA
jgi:cholesterol oxidase